MNYIYVNTIEGGGWGVYVGEDDSFRIHEFPQYGGEPQEIKKTFDSLDEAIIYAEKNLT